jgi:conjugative relaxase-like TrwC/TraI family protein
MRMMGLDSVAYHRSTVAERSDDHPGAALDYYASRGETPLLWAGRGAAALGLSAAADLTGISATDSVSRAASPADAGIVTPAAYEAIFGPDGARDPSTRERLVNSKRPGLELVIGAHKSVAELGVIGRAEDMHQIMDAERDATLSYLDDITQRMGGRRGRAATPTPTDGLTYAVTRHATSRAGDPSPHDHVLLANVVRMNDAAGGTKGADTALWREHLHAATAIGRMASAHKAIELGYDIIPDHGPSGRLGHWAIAGVPKEAMEVHSKRAAEITEAVQDRGTDTYRSRQVAARNTRDPKRHQPVEDLMVRWHAELAEIGCPVPELLASVQEASRTRHVRPDAPSRSELRELVTQTLAPESDLARRKVFNRRDVVVAVAPQLFGCDPSVLPRVVDRVLGDPEAVPLLGVAEKREQAYATARGMATEQAIAEVVERMAQRRNAPAVPFTGAAEAIAAREDLLGGHLTAGQDAAVRAITTSGRGIDIVVGVAGSGKTTALAAVRDAFSTASATAGPDPAIAAANAPFLPVGLRRTLLEAAGPPRPEPPYELIGTAVSGQAARTLGSEAGIDPSRTAASVLWRLDHDQLALSERSVLVLDEAGMADDATTLRLLTAAERAGAKVVIVGDDRQLPAIGAGGALGAVLDRHPEAVHVLAENVRQRDGGEREALGQLRAGKVAEAVDWYVANDRIVTKPTIEEARSALVAAWAADIATPKPGTEPDDDIAMFAWRRVNVAELNRLGRAAWAEMGNLSSPELTAPGGAAYAAGDRIVTLAPGARGQLVTSERGSVLVVDPEARTLTALMDDGRTQHFATEDIGADRLAHGYAVTVHRSQGLTVDATHALEDGGGRELAYVRNSRARGATTLYAVADDVEMAAEDLRRAWSNETRQRWAIDRQPSDPRTPGFGLGQPATSPPAVRLARLRSEHEALAAIIPPKPEADWRAQGHLNGLRNALRDLDTDNAYGVYAGTPLAEALTAWKAVHYERTGAEMHSHEGPLLRRPGFARAARDAAEREAPLEAAYRAMADLERARIAPQLADAEAHLAAREAQETAHLRYVRIDHPEVPRRLEWIEREMDGLSDELYDTRMGLENAVGEGWEHADPTWADRGHRPQRPGPGVEEDSTALAMLRDRAIERAAIEIDFGPDLGL